MQGPLIVTLQRPSIHKREEGGSITFNLYFFPITIFLIFWGNGGSEWEYELLRWRKEREGGRGGRGWLYDPPTSKWVRVRGREEGRGSSV